MRLRGSPGHSYDPKVPHLPMHTIIGAKVQPFGTEDDESKFEAVLKAWREDVINGSEIKSTAFTRVYEFNFFTRWFRVYKHYQYESTRNSFWFKENDTSEKAWKAGEKVHEMRTMLYRIEEAVSSCELEEIYLESKEALLDGDDDGKFRNMMARVWGPDKVKLYDTKELISQKLKKAQWNTALLKARKKALDEALVAEEKKQAAKKAKEPATVDDAGGREESSTVASQTEREAAVEAAEGAEAAEEKPAKEEEEAQHVILDIAEEGQQEFDAEKEVMSKRLKLEIDMEISSQQGDLLDDHQSHVMPKQYSASSPPHARARDCICVSPHTVSRPASHTQTSPICLRSPHSPSAHRNGPRQVQGQDPKSEYVCCRV